MEKILIAVDNSKYLEKILNYIIKIFKGRDDLTLHFFHIKRPCYILDDLITEEIDKDILLQKIEELRRDKNKCKLESQKIVDQIKEKIEAFTQKMGEKRPKVEFEVVEETEDYATTILKKSKDIDAHTIIVGRKGDSIISEYLIGSTADKLVRITRDKTIWLIE
ncbi:MAG: universal stress protein [Proteobacteria bacterium]|nr:universal stress protein [Pseudomonadota bacterium]